MKSTDFTVRHRRIGSPSSSRPSPIEATSRVPWLICDGAVARGVRREVKCERSAFTVAKAPLVQAFLDQRDNALTSSLLEM